MKADQIFKFYTQWCPPPTNFLNETCIFVSHFLLFEVFVSYHQVAAPVWSHSYKERINSACPVLYVWKMPVCVVIYSAWHKYALVNQLCSSSRFRMLAEHFQKMYQNLNINIDNELEQLKVRETTG